MKRVLARSKTMSLSRRGHKRILKRMIKALIMLRLRWAFGS
jgi:hypothetical protein